MKKKNGEKSACHPSICLAAVLIFYSHVLLATCVWVRYVLLATCMWVRCSKMNTSSIYFGAYPSLGIFNLFGRLYVSKIDTYFSLGPNPGVITGNNSHFCFWGGGQHTNLWFSNSTCGFQSHLRLKHVLDNTLTCG